MTLQLRLLAGLALLTLAFASSAQDGKGSKDKSDKSDFASVGDVHAELTVLNVLYILQPTPTQVEALRKAAGKTMQKPPPRKRVKVSDKLRRSMVQLRDALASNDSEKIDDLFDQYTKLQEKEDPEFDDLEITDEARAQAPALFRLLGARQVATYIGSVQDFPDPVERLLETMEDGRKLRAKEWQALRDDAAYQVGWLIAGLDTRQEEKIRDQATALLNRVYKLSDKEFEASREKLETEAGNLVGKVTSLDIIRHFMERVLAETLSSHRFEAALALRERKN